MKARIRLTLAGAETGLLAAALMASASTADALVGHAAQVGGTDGTDGIGVVAAGGAGKRAATASVVLEVRAEPVPSASASTGRTV